MKTVLEQTWCSTLVSQRKSEMVMKWLQRNR